MKRRNFFWYSLLFLTSCTTAKNNSSLSNSADLTKLEKLRFAVTDVQGMEKLESDYGELRTALAEVLGTNIEFFPVDNYTAAASALQLNQVDLVLAGPSEYVIIKSTTNAVPVTAITRVNYHSVIVVPSQSSIKAVTDLKGKTIAMSDIGSTSGHLGPTKLLIDAGLNPKSDLKVMMLGDEGSIAAIKQGKVDAWGGSAVDYEAFLKTADNQFPILVEGPSLPSDIFIANSQIDLQIVEKMRVLMVESQDKLVQALVKGEATSKYKGSQLVAANDADYDIIRQVYKAIGEGNFF